jgi:short-subunit dehydrogenase
MSFSLKDKKIVITGSSDGLGRLLALELAKNGASIIVHGRSEEKTASALGEIEKNNPEGKHEKIICDFNSPETISDIFSKIEKIDILINNTGVWGEGATIEATPEKIMEMVNVNLTSYLLVTRILLPKLQEAEFGQILNVSSVAGVEIPFDYYHTIYSATKFGVQAFSEALAKEFEDKTLRVMGYYPGGMKTGFFKKAGLDYKDNEPWMFDPKESVEAIIFMLTRDKKINLKRMDLINHLQVSG